MEVQTWSDGILKTLVEEEDCCLAVRNACSNELKSRSAGDIGKITLTWDMIQDASTLNGAWTLAQLQILGIKWPPKKGWLKNLIGKQVTHEQWERFVKASEIRRHPRNPSVN